MSAIANLDATPRAISFVVALQAVTGETMGAQCGLLELIAWLAFDRPTAFDVPLTELSKTSTTARR